MTSPIRSREDALYTPSDPEEPVCSAPPPNPEPDGETMTRADGTCAEGELTSRSGPNPSHQNGTSEQSSGRKDVDYVTVSLGAGEIIGGNASLTLARDGHLYFGLAGGVALSATVLGFSAVAGQMTTAEPPKDHQLDNFLEGDSVGASASVIAQTGITNSPGGTAAEMGIGGPVQVSAQFQHNWHVSNLPIRW